MGAISDKEESPDLRDPCQLTEFYDRISRRLCIWCYYKLGNWHDAEDLTSETFIKFTQVLKDGKQKDGEQIEHPEAYLFQIAKNGVRDRAKLPKDIPLDPDKHGPPEEKQIDAGIQVARGTLEKILKAISELPPSEREVVELRIFWRDECTLVLDELGLDKDHIQDPRFSRLGGASVKDIAKLLGKTPGAVQRAYSRGLAKIKKAIGYMP